MIRTLFLIFTITFFGCHQQSNTNLTIATAANMQFAMEELIPAFTEETGIACETIFSSSGKLTAQIMEGAPFDVFLSADMKYPNMLHNEGLSTIPPKIYAYGQIVLWTQVDGIVPSIDILTEDYIKHIAIPNPKTAPYGKSAFEMLEYHGLLEKVKNKLVYGESIAQTNQFINSKATEIGFTAKSVVLSPKMRDLGKWVDVKKGTYKPISQGIVLLNSHESKRENAQKFYDFLFSTKGKEILNKFGYSVTE